MLPPSPLPHGLVDFTGGQGLFSAVFLETPASPSLLLQTSLQSGFKDMGTSRCSGQTEYLPSPGRGPGQCCQAPRGLWDCVNGHGKAFAPHHDSHAGHLQSRGEGKGETNTQSLPVLPAEPGFMYLTSAGHLSHLLSLAKLVGFPMRQTGNWSQNTQLGTPTRALGEAAPPLAQV